jgi:tetratricopeptide (TPR) repeat protein
MSMNVVMNLNGILLCPFQGALDIAAQISENYAMLTELAFKPVTELNTINDWVNIDDSVGDPTAIRAQEATDIISSLLNHRAITSLAIHVDLGDNVLTIDNFFTILFLAKQLTNLEVFFYVSPNKLSALQVLTRKLQEREHLIVHYRHAERFFNNISYVKKAKQLENQRYQLLNTLGYPYNAALDASQSNLGSIVSYAWSCLKSGAYPLGCQLIEYLLEQKNLQDMVREELFVHLQIIRFLSHQHDKINSALFPEHFHFISHDRIEHLYFIRAFAATLTRKLDMADVFFQQANIGINMPITDEDSIYKLNLYALFLLIKGDTDTAFLLETQLLDYLQNHDIDSTALHHVVLMNIARLYKKSKNYDLASDYYKKAYYQLSGGGFTPFDFMNYAIDRAILSEARNDMLDALFYWASVALCWLSCSNHYALPVRTRLVLCNEKVTDTIAPLSKEQVNQLLLEKITYLCTVTDCEINLNNQQLLTFIVDQTKNIPKKTCHVTHHMIICSGVLPKELIVVQETSMGHALQRLLSSLMRTYMDIHDNENVVSIATHYECFHPQSQDECMSLALLSKSDTCYYNRELLHIDHTLIKNIRVTLSRMIKAIETTSKGINLIYKRSFLNKHLESPEEIALINLINNEQSINFSQSNDYCPDLMMRLFNKQIISFNLFIK